MNQISLFLFLLFLLLFTFVSGSALIVWCKPHTIGILDFIPSDRGVHGKRGWRRKERVSALDCTPMSDGVPFACVTQGRESFSLSHSFVSYFHRHFPSSGWVCVSVWGIHILVGMMLFSIWGIFFFLHTDVEANIEKVASNSFVGNR